MKIWASYDIYLDRQSNDDWPDIWAAGEERWMRPHKLSLTIRQKADEAEPRLVRAWASCQKRWANSQRLTSMSTWYSVTVWEVDGPVPEWLKSYVSEAMSRISAVSDPAWLHDISPACQLADCNHCASGDECLCACHIDDHGGDPDDI